MGFSTCDIKQDAAGTRSVVQRWEYLCMGSIHATEREDIDFYRENTRAWV